MSIGYRRGLTQIVDILVNPFSSHMVKAEVTKKKDRASINLPNSIIEEIDEYGIGMYASRGDFITCAMRNLLREITFLRRKSERRMIRKGMSPKEAVLTSRDESFVYLAKIQKGYRWEGIRSTTGLTAYLTELQFELLSEYYDRMGPVKTVQDFGRIAAIRELDILKHDEMLTEEILMDLVNSGE